MRKYFTRRLNNNNYNMSHFNFQSVEKGDVIVLKLVGSLIDSSHGITLLDKIEEFIEKGKSKFVLDNLTLYTCCHQSAHKHTYIVMCKPKFRSSNVKCTHPSTQTVNLGSKLNGLTVFPVQVSRTSLFLCHEN